MTRHNRIARLLVICGLFAAAQAGAVELRIATVAPGDSEWLQALRADADEIAQRTDGRVTVKYFPGGVQGKDAQVVRKMRIGQLQGGIFTASSMNKIYPDINLYGLPMIFDSYGEADYVRHRMDQQLIDGLAEKGFVTFGFAATGFAMVMSHDPVRGIDDLKGKKVWVPEGDDVSYKAMQALSVSPTPLPMADVFTSLQTGNIDIATVSPIGALLLQWYTRVSYVTDLPIVYTFGYMVIDKGVFDKLQPEDQQVVREIFGKTYADFDKKNIVENDEALAAITRKELQKIEVSEQEVARLRTTLDKANHDLAEEGVVSLDMYEAMLQYRAEYRSGQAAEQLAEADPGQ